MDEAGVFPGLNLVVRQAGFGEAVEGDLARGIARGVKRLLECLNTKLTGGSGHDQAASSITSA